MDVHIRWAEPHEESPHPRGGWAQWWWPAAAPLPEVGDSIRLPSSSPLPGPVRVLEREWVCAWDEVNRASVVVLELAAELIR